MKQITLDFKSATPIFEQLKEQIRFQVLAGQLAPGDQLPPIRALAVELRLNPNTVARVYRELELEGLIETSQGRGSFIALPRQPENLQLQRQARLRQDAATLLETSRQLGFSAADLITLIQEMENERPCH